MKFSIITASYLGDYRNAAKNREQKIIRAVNSVLHQTFQDFEMIVVADGCQSTVEIIKQINDPRIRTFLINRSKIFSGAPRNKGIEEAEGEYIIYLDIDDIYGTCHLQNISDQLNGWDWVWFNDVRYNPKKNEWYENPCDINVISRHGTSNICHRRSMNVRWIAEGYAHDYYFIQSLKYDKNFTKINGGDYYVCHIPGMYDV